MRSDLPMIKTKLPLLLFGILFSFTGFGQITYKDLNIDSSLTGFKFAADFQGTMVYRKIGPADIKSINPSAYSFTIPNGLIAKDALQQLEYLYNMSSQGGYSITNTFRNDTTL